MVMHPSIATAEPRPLWWEGLDDEFGTRSALEDDLDVDVAIVGGGYTGLWTAYELAAADPSLSIAVLERNHVGFGASGRNGGWCYDGFAAGMGRIEKMSNLDTARRFGAALRETVDEVGKVVAAEGIDCDFHKAGSVEFLRNHAQLVRAEDDVESYRRYGWTVDDVRILSPGEATDIARVTNLQGGLWSRHTAALQPARLAHGLAHAAERRGVHIYEDTEVTGIEPHRVTIDGGGVVTARVIVRALEGYTAELPSHHRELTPLYSIMIGTEPLPDDLWDEIGFADRQTFGDLRHMVVYGQRTADGRITFGGRGAPYDYGSRIRRNADFPAETFGPIRETLVELLPQLSDVEITHRWGGVLGVSRTWMPTVGYDPASGLAWAGGYVGSGVAATNLAGRTLADLITEQSTEITGFPWVNHRVRRWEPEPLRWIAFTAALRVMAGADRAEARTGRRSKRADALWWLAEH
jgi:glycine/D-amino acid oxidase-like deaminating enzyme